MRAQSLNTYGLDRIKR